jgi:hypothetical protein
MTVTKKHVVKKKAQLEPPKKAEAVYRTPKGEVPTKEVVNIFADSIEKLYEEFGGKIDRTNALDKALNLVRELSVRHKIPFKEKEL